MTVLFSPFPLSSSYLPSFRPRVARSVVVDSLLRCESKDRADYLVWISPITESHFIFISFIRKFQSFLDAMNELRWNCQLAFTGIFKFKFKFKILLSQWDSCEHLLFRFILDWYAPNTLRLYFGVGMAAVVGIVRSLGIRHIPMTELAHVYAMYMLCICYGYATNYFTDPSIHAIWDPSSQAEIRSN